MQALNFLTIDPTPNWIDYYLNIEKLRSLLAAKENELLEKGLVQVANEFCEQAQSLESRLREFHGTDEERLFVERRTAKLRAMGIYVCAHWKWNLFRIRDSLGVVNSRYLLEKFCEMVIPNFSTLIGMFDMVSSAITHGLQRFLIVLSARWVLHSIVYENFVDTATKRLMYFSTQSSNKPNLQEAYQLSLTELETMAAAAEKFLLQFCEDSSASLLFPGTSCFRFSNADEDLMDFLPEACDQISYDSHRLMALFDLGEHFFFEQKFSEAKECFSLILPHCSMLEEDANAHFYISSETLHGYAVALDIPLPEDVAVPIEHVLNEAPSEQTAVFLLEDIPEGTVSLARRLLIERKASETVLPVYAEVYSANIIRNFKEGFPLTRSFLNFVARSENLAIFCLTLIKAKKLELLEDGRVIRPILEFLCQRIPSFFDSLSSCGLLALLSDEERPRLLGQRPVVSERKRSPSASRCFGKVSLKLGEDPWDMAFCSSSSEFKNIILKPDAPMRFHRSEVFTSNAMIDFREQLRGSDALFVRLCFFHVDRLLGVNRLSRLNDTSVVLPDCWPSFLRERTTPVCFKHYSTCKSWLEACRAALTPATANYLAMEYENELLRRELIIWHRLLGSHVKRDVRKWTQTIANNVRAYIADQWRVPVDMNKPSDLNFLVTCFLVNTSDWEYILCQGRDGLRGKYVDFAKVLAALCFELSKEGPNTRTYARDFFDIVTTAFATSGQGKRTGGTPTKIPRETDGPFLNQKQFIRMLQLIREPLCISILLSFFCKIYNSSQHMFVELIAEHNVLWPVTFQSTNSFDLSFLTEALEVVLQNAMLMQPNNASWARTFGDFYLTIEKYGSSMKYYLQALVIKSVYFTEEVGSDFFDKRMLNNMIKCCNKLRYHTIEAMLCQCSNPPNYTLACKACSEPCSWDGSEQFYKLTWDPTMLECFIATLSSRKQRRRRNLLLKEMARGELNTFNAPEFLEIMVQRRKTEFFRAVYFFLV